MLVRMNTCAEEKELKINESHVHKDPLFPPLSQGNKPPGISTSMTGRHSSKSRRVHSSLPITSRQPGHSSLSSRTSSSVASAQSGSSALEEKEAGKQETLTRLASSIDSETLAIAIELKNLKARRERDEQETLARIMDVSDQLGSLKSKSRAMSARPRSFTASPKVTEAPPPTEAYTGPGAHYLDWYIPKHIAGSRALQRTTSAVNRKPEKVSSPLHSLEKHEWMDKTIDPKASGLHIPTPVRPRILDYPCTWENNLKDELKKYRFKLDPCASVHLQDHTPSPAPRPRTMSAPLKSLSLSPRKAKKKTIDSSDLKLNGSMFIKAQAAPISWFIVHPEWRNEPSITQTLTKTRADNGDGAKEEKKLQG